jgi:hypothetical protein
VREPKSEAAYDAVTGSRSEAHQNVVEEVNRAHRNWQSREADDIEGKAKKLDEERAPKDLPTEHRRGPSVIDKVSRAGEIQRGSGLREVITEWNVRKRMHEKDAGCCQKSAKESVTAR